MYAKRFQKRKAKKTIRRTSRKSNGARKSITKIVKSVISRQAENKAWFDYGVNQGIGTVSLNTPVYENLIPLLSQGVGHSNRVGNEVTVKSGYIRGHVNILPYDATTNSLPAPVYVKMWVLSSKVINTHLLGDTDIDANFFDIVNSSTSFQGNMLDMDLSVNKDSFIIHATKTVKLGLGYSASTGPGGVDSVVGYYDNSPMTVPFYFNTGKYLKTLKYDDTVSYCINKNLFLAFQCVAANGAPSSGQTMAEYHYSQRVNFQDM